MRIIMVSLSVLHSILYCINAQEVNECNSIPCKYGGTCSDLVNAFTCACTNGYSGTNCQVASLGSSCSQSGTICADPNASCQSNGQGGSTCQCTSLYYDNDGGDNIGGTCTSKVGLGQNCPLPNACLTSNSECIGGTCRCTDNFYDTNTADTNGGSCVSRRNLGLSCRSDHTNIKQCIDLNASCQGSPYSCSCDDHYHQDGSKCVPNVALDDQCKGNVADECSDPNAECINRKCTCSVGFYQFKSNSQSNCRDVTELRVTGITFSNVKTTEYTVSWTVSARFTYVSGYDVEWQTAGKVVGASSPHKVTGLTPGKVYELKVISKDTVTQSGVTRTTYTSKQQATKPSVPGAVTSSGNDLDALDRNILIRWTSGTGVATKYTIKFFDGESQKGSKETSTLSSSFSGVLNGHRYKVVITARSEQFNGNYIWSEERVSQIKTKVQVPEAPRNGFCQSSIDSTITLDWDAPTLPNGDLVRYHIDVRDTSNKFIFRDVTTATETQKVVGNLQPSTSYIFRLYTENEQYISTSYDQVSSSCKTRAKLSDPPTKLTLTEVTSRGFDISWKKPNNTYSEENYGYVLQIKDDRYTCWKEVIYRCSDFQLSYLTGLCEPSKRDKINDKTKWELANKLIYSATLHPDIAYTVPVTAINDAGRSHPATVTQKTNEEAPKTPYGVKVVYKNATAFYLTWKIDGPRPGNTDFMITLIAEAPAVSMNYKTSGFDVREFTASGLQEYWNYNVSVTAVTSVGSSRSAVTNYYRTLPSAPGKVSEFKIEYHPGGDYTKMRVTWKMPTVLERNGIVASYKFEHFVTGMITSTKKNFIQEAEGSLYTITIDVRPGEMYNITVFAINEDNRIGEKQSAVIEAPAGVPIYIETCHCNSIIQTDMAKNVGETHFTVSIVQDFFTEATYGKIQETGLIICSKKYCAPNSTVKTLADFDSMKNWKEDKEAYRPTNKTWLIDTIQNNAAKVPIYIETCHCNSIIQTDMAKNVGETHFTVSIVQDFFTEATYGKIQETGLIICSKKYCAPNSTVKTLADFDSMKNWKEDKEAYRPTNKTWLIDTIQNNAAKGRENRSLTYLEYTVGSDKCPELTSGQYCNGPLQTGKSYYIFAVSCTNGGCLVSEPNGPFITKAAQVTDGWNCSTQSVVIGAVLGLIILILLVYAGYTTITIRRMRAEYGQNIIKSNKNRNISQTYVNETFGTGMPGVLNERNVQHAGIAAGYTETEYSILDNDSREDKATYDILIPGYEK